MKQPNPYIHRDISWLSFNYRVLQEAKDENVPLYERIKFLSIYSSNLGEFFRVRVSNLKNLVRAGKKNLKNLEFEPKKVLNEIIKIVTQQQKEFSEIFENEIKPALKKENVILLRANELNAIQRSHILAYFNDNLLPYIQPILLKEDKVKPFLQNGALYLAIYMKDKGKSEKKNYALVKVPSDITPRFIKLPSKEQQHIIYLDDLVREIIPSIFPGFKIIDSFSIKLTRDAELYIDDEYSGDLVQKIKKSLKNRDIGPASRLVYDRSMPEHLLKYLKLVFEIEDNDLLPEGRYHNNFDLLKFPNFSKNQLKDIALPHLEYSQIREKDDIFKAIRKQDHLLYFPYHSYETVVKFFKDAAVDKKVTHINIIQYRVAKDSKIMDALIKAAKNGKQVTAFIEVKARFDEEANLYWGEILEKNGVKVHYSMPGLKVHSKMAMIRRVSDGEEQYYCYLSTGNFHEGTAKVYTDFGFFTYDKRIVTEARRIFYYLETKNKPNKDFKYLGAGPFNLKQKLKQLIKNEISNAKSGKKALITMKMNSLQDPEMINLLYSASQVGVKVKLIVRGICCLAPGLKGISENIKAVSIVDKYLEHARVFIFHNKGDELIYLSSADLMVRNLNHRVETMFPIFDEYLKYIIKTIIKIQLSDNVKARLHDYKNNNKYAKNDGMPVRSQYDIYYFIKRRMEKDD